MSEEEIIYILKQRIERKTVSSDPYYITQKAIEGILDLYQKEKEKNEKLKDKIRARIEELQSMYNELPINPKEHLHSKTEYKIVIGELQELLEERN